MYDSERFIVMTGNHLSGTPSDIYERQDILNYIYDMYFPDKKKQKKITQTDLNPSPPLADEEVLNIGYRAKNGDRFKALYSGDFSAYGSQSEADQALCNYLAFYTQDFLQIDRIFSGSGLYRDKWEREDYKATTINKAIQGLNATYKKPDDNYHLHVKGSGDSFVIPKPFDVTSGSLYSIKKATKENEKDKKIFVSRHVPFLTKEFHNVERPQVLYEITWKHANRTINEVVTASTISIKRELLELSDKGLSVNDNNAKALIQFMDLYLSENDIEKHYAVERLGSIKDKFIHPAMSKDVEIMAIDQGEKQILEGFEVKGTVETWKNEVFERIKDSPKAVFFVLASFASVIINDLRVQPFIVDLSGTTSQGKTTTLKIASTVWGNTKLLNEWNATKVSIERKAAYLNSFPLLMDDTRKADERVLQDVIYQFSGGRSKGRGSVKGSQREYTWNNILLSTGEVSLNEYAKSAGGVAARVIPLIDEPLKKDHKNIAQLHEAMENNYGAIGVEFLKIWIAHRNEFIYEYHRFKSHYTDKAKDNEVLSRLAGYYAAVHFTGSILKDKLRLDIDLKAMSVLFDDIAKENKAVDKPMQFLEGILTDLDSKRDSIYYNFKPRQGVKAIYNDKQKQLYLTPAYTSEFLGVEEVQTRREWLKRGITTPLERDERTVDYKLVSHKGTKFRAIALNMDLIEELGFHFHEDNNG
ncbi:DUF927 domain-containing protein [bacterium LRH843]|nr:DUF927 domain-containing protein [bacterium LRH843]